MIPDRLPDAVRSHRYLSIIDRQRIDSLHQQGVTGLEIAGRLDRSPSTVSRELRRNTDRHDRGGYDAVLAHSRARARGARPGRARLASDSDLRALVQGKLELEWSPEQIAAHLREAFPDRPGWHLCHETIYQALYRGARGGFSRRLTQRLRTGRPLRKRRRHPDERRTRYVVPHRALGIGLRSSPSGCVWAVGNLNDVVKPPGWPRGVVRRRVGCRGAGPRARRCGGGRGR